MTFREKIQRAHPNYVHKGYCGGVSGCPSDFDYENENESLCVGHLDPSRKKCTKCWGREVPTTLDAKKNNV